MNKTLLVTISVAALIATGIASAQQQGNQGNQGRGPRRKPPDEAIAACSSLSSNDSCSFTIEMTGTCKEPPNGQGELACAPDRPPRSGGQGQGQGMGGGRGPGQNMCGDDGE